MLRGLISMTCTRELSLQSKPDRKTILASQRDVRAWTLTSKEA